MEIFPFVTLAYRSNEIKAKWEPLRGRIYGATAFAEYEMVKRGYRRCDVYDFTPDNVLPRLKKVVADGLVFMPILVSQTYGGYGHRHYLTSKFTDGTFIYGAVAQTRDDAVRFHDAGVTDVNMRIDNHPDMNPTGIDHTITGALLGYPICCTEFFEETWLKGGCVDPMFEMAVATEGVDILRAFTGNHVKVQGNPMLNRLARYWGFNIIPFFPHSFTCSKAADFADTFYSLMREYDCEAAEACLEVLSMPMRWSMTNMITTLDHPLFWGSANGYYREGTVTVDWFPHD